MFDLVPPDVVAAVFDLLDARDVLRAAAGLRRPLTNMLPRGWTFQAQRPLTASEYTGLLGVGVPKVELWSVCPSKPDGLMLIWRNSYGDYADQSVVVLTDGNNFIYLAHNYRFEDVYEDHRGILYLDLHSGVPNTFNCWRAISDLSFHFIKGRRWLSILDRTSERRFQSGAWWENLSAPPLLLTCC